MVLGIEVGGTKLQLGVSGDGRELVERVRLDVDRTRGAEGILQQISEQGVRLCRKHGVQRIGVGFGGPVDSASGCVTTSHQVAGWDGFPLGRWCYESFGAPATLENDCNVAALAEAQVGAGAGQDRVLYVTVGTGIGAGMVVGGRLEGTTRPAIAELGHLRPGLAAADARQTVEAVAAGPGIVAAAARYCSTAQRPPADAREVFQRAAEGDLASRSAVRLATTTLGWAIAQAITLWAPDVVIVGGGVAQASRAQFWDPLAEAISRYVFPPLKNSYQLLPPQLGEWVVVHGAILHALGARE